MDKRIREFSKSNGYSHPLGFEENEDYIVELQIYYFAPHEERALFKTNSGCGEWKVTHERLLDLNKELG